MNKRIARPMIIRTLSLIHEQLNLHARVLHLGHHILVTVGTINQLRTTNHEMNENERSRQSHIRKGHGRRSIGVHNIHRNNLARIDHTNRVIHKLRLLAFYFHQVRRGKRLRYIRRRLNRRSCHRRIGFRLSWCRKRLRQIGRRLNRDGLLRNGILYRLDSSRDLWVCTNRNSGNRS